MTIPAWVLLAFALWTVLVLIATVGVYRWRRIIAGSVPIHEFRYDAIEGHEDWYRRAMRAHGNCVENLPVYGAIVLILSLTSLDGRVLDMLAIALIVARVVQTLVHVSFRETDFTVSVRFGFFAVQMFVMLWMFIVIVIANA
jgi:uncharacterized membrane protein YecN with MAPEG domain